MSDAVVQWVVGCITEDGDFIADFVPETDRERAVENARAYAENAGVWLYGEVKPAIVKRAILDSEPEIV